MGRSGATITAGLLLWAVTAPAVAQMPAQTPAAPPRVASGDLGVRGTQRRAGASVALEGVLTIAGVESGAITLTRRVRAADGATTTWSGPATLEGGALSGRLASSEGLSGALQGARGASVQAVYRLEADGSLRGALTADGWTGEEVARGPAPTGLEDRAATARMSKAEYFAFLDRDPALQVAARRDALTAFLDLLVRADVPPAVDGSYTAKAGSPGAGRVLLALDYTRGIDTEPTWWEALRGGPKHALTAKILTPMLTHFRGVDGSTMFQGDVGFVRPFRDSALTSPRTCQVGHMLCALESGQRLGWYERRPFRRRLFQLSMRLAARVMGMKGVTPTVADWSRAGIIGHEMIGDEDGSGFLGQMNTFGRLVADGDKEGIRAAWDRAVASVLSCDHLAAWTGIRTIARAGEVPETAAEMQANRANPHPRFARPGDPRGGNTLADLGLSVYGFALGYRTATAGYATPAVARADLEGLLAAWGAQAPGVERACVSTR